MATLPNLIDVIAKIDGRDHATLDHMARLIRDAGFIAKGKRGRGAIDMTARDAANLLLGLNGAEAPGDAPAAVSRLRMLRTQFVDVAGTTDTGER